MSHRKCLPLHSPSCSCKAYNEYNIHLGKWWIFDIVLGDRHFPRKDWYKGIFKPYFWKGISSYYNIFAWKYGGMLYKDSFLQNLHHNIWLYLYEKQAIKPFGWLFRKYRIVRAKLLSR